MTLAEFINKAESKIVNTCNGWGFGGHYGNSYTLEGLNFLDVKYSSRHQGSWKAQRFYANSQEVEKKEFINLISKL